MGILVTAILRGNPPLADRCDMDAKQIDELRRELLAKARELSELIERSDVQTRPVELDQQSVGRVSRIDAIQQQQMALASRAQAEQQLQGIELALGRIESGEYGYCRQCGDAIAFARLQAQPFAVLCIDCQSANENL